MSNVIFFHLFAGLAAWDVSTHEYGWATWTALQAIYCVMQIVGERKA